MSRKLTCPGCNAHTSEVANAFDHGHPCPTCGLSAEAAAEVASAQRRAADAELTRRYEELVVRNDFAEAEAARLRLRLDRVRRALDDEEVPF